MASGSLQLLLCTLLLSLSTFPTHARKPSTPHPLYLPVSKDTTTLQYVTHLSQRTPLVPVKLVVDLGGICLWVSCDFDYVSSSYKPSHCKSKQCVHAAAIGGYCSSCNGNPASQPGCNKNACSFNLGNPFHEVIANGEIAQDIIAIQSTDDGTTAGPLLTVPRFQFTCGIPFLLGGFSSGAKGMVGLGRTNISLPTQLADTVGVARKFAVCLSSSKGVVFFGDGPYVVLPRMDVSQGLTYTPILKNPVRTAVEYFDGYPSYEYFIGVKSIKINGKAVPLNASLLSFDKGGNGGTKISTVDPYTKMETSIYNAFTEAFVREAMSIKMTKVASVAPFKTCFSSKGVPSTRVGPAVPKIDLVLQSESVYWRIFGANSMVQVNKEVLCLGFVDGGVNARTSIVIGGYQLEDNLLQFDLGKSMLGFSSSLLSKQTTCANFNFTSKA
ncbi:hypothetical protein QJS10_CPB17g01917 [Acorus calamus]|uniref:Peptidase A1 domain-containing protein n=1 Tax=Acorus calamus TaxID=4465 RepID=A0AAV9CUM8_ACOCL|nr:hypothetical protein QJS10_CPB17g01917 [Acorus calamus]